MADEGDDEMEGVVYSSDKTEAAENAKEPKERVAVGYPAPGIFGIL